MPSSLRSAVCGRLIDLTGHRICCRIPAWTAYVGQRWHTYDVAPWNLYNAWWRVGQWVARHAEAGDE
jgi:hypothetical protein